MSEKFLLKEFTTVEIKPDILKEYSDDPQKPITIIGVVQRADALNQNKRIYPYDVLRKAADEYLEEVVKNGCGYGELDHRDTPVVEYKNASHIIEDLWWDGADKKDLYGKIRLLKTPAGQIAETILRDSGKLGISSRAVGSISENKRSGGDVVGDDLKFICWDLVANPSTHQAFLKIHESFDPYSSIPKSARIKQTLREILKK